MKNLKLKYPVLTTSDKLKLISYADYFGFQAVIDTKAKKALMVRDDDSIGFIQKNENGRIYVLYKDETVHNIGDYANLIRSLNKYNLIPLPDNDVDITTLINMQSLKLITA